MNNIELSDYKKLLLEEIPLIDVRAPVEFSNGSLPFSVNAPILNDEERDLIGKSYKSEGNQAAVQLGLKLVSGQNKKNKIDAWVSFIQKDPRTVLYCFRGGSRSRFTQQWLKEIGFDRPLIVGGYKRIRYFLIQELIRLANDFEFQVITGPTGSGKTEWMRSLDFPYLDLEGRAHHRGSAFGFSDINQPSQVDFENRLARDFIVIENKIQQHIPLKSILIEDESRMIGQNVIPENLFLKMRNSGVIYLDLSLEDRVDQIYKDYILNTSIGNNDFEKAIILFDRYIVSLSKISKKLGGLRTSEIKKDLEFSKKEFLNNRKIESNRVWIEKLLKYYYDPLYLGSLDRRNPKINFRGSKKEALEYIQSFKK